MLANDMDLDCGIASDLDFNVGSFCDDESTDENSKNEQLLLYILLRRRLARRKNRTIWTTDVTTEEQRLKHGVYRTLIPNFTDEQYKRYFRVTRSEFDEIHSFVEQDLKKKFTSFRTPISTKHRLAICLRFLASGETIRSLSYQFRMGETTASNIVKEVCDAIWSRMQEEYIPVPTEEFWLQKAAEFESRWNFPNCLSSLDGKHVILIKPKRSGSDYFSYKKSFSIVLLAGVDANYKFTFVDIGVKGRFSDGFTLAHSNFGKRLLSQTLNIPQPRKLQGENETFPYVFVGDAAFPIMENLMRPYPGTSTATSTPNRIFNYRLSHARQTVECAFGILSARFRIYQRPLEFQPSVVEKFVKCTCVLHNYIRSKRSFDQEIADIPAPDFDDPVNQLVALGGSRARSKKKAYDIREQFRNYFILKNPLPYQNEAVRNGKY